MKFSHSIWPIWFTFQNEIAIFQPVNQIPHFIFENTSQFYFKFCINLQCHQTQLLYTFLAQTLYTLIKKTPLRSKFLRLLGDRVKISRTPQVNFETTSQFLLKTLHHSSFFMTQILCKFLAHLLGEGSERPRYFCNHLQAGDFSISLASL